MKRFIPFMTPDPLVAVLRLQGPIGTGQRGMDDLSLAPLIERAFKRGKPAAVALQINSPGGSPVQSSLIAARIRRLAQENDVPVFAFVEDVAASGGYWLACAADEIYVDASSMVGSIGVISAGFGLHEAIGRFGIERRVHTAGRSKSMLDPFRPETSEDVARLDGWLGQIHQNFIDHVSARRAGKLNTDEDLFTGEVWIGPSAVKAGLADGVGHLVPEMQRRFGDKVVIKRYPARRGLMQRLGVSAVDGVASAIEERTAFARFGL